VGQEPPRLVGDHGRGPLAGVGLEFVPRLTQLLVDLATQALVTLEKPVRLHRVLDHLRLALLAAPQPVETEHGAVAEHLHVVGVLLEEPPRDLVRLRHGGLGAHPDQRPRQQDPEVAILRQLRHQAPGLLHRLLLGAVHLQQGHHVVLEPEPVGRFEAEGLVKALRRLSPPRAVGIRLGRPGEDRAEGSPCLRRLRQLVPELLGGVDGRSVVADGGGGLGAQEVELLRLEVLGPLHAFLRRHPVFHGGEEVQARFRIRRRPPLVDQRAGGDPHEPEVPWRHLQRRPGLGPRGVGLARVEQSGHDRIEDVLILRDQPPCGLEVLERLRVAAFDQDQKPLCVGDATVRHVVAFSAQGEPGATDVTQGQEALDLVHRLAPGLRVAGHGEPGGQAGQDQKHDDNGNRATHPGMVPESSLRVLLSRREHGQNHRRVGAQTRRPAVRRVDA